MKLLTLCGAVHLFLMTAYAAVIPSQTYTEFDWEDSSSKSFAIDLNSASRIHVADLDAASKGFRVYDNGNFVGETFTKASDDAISPFYNTYPYLQGYFNLAKGHHVIELQLKEPTEGKGSGLIRVLPESKITLNIIFTMNYVLSLFL